MPAPKTIPYAGGPGLLRRIDVDGHHMETCEILCGCGHLRILHHLDGCRDDKDSSRHGRGRCEHDGCVCNQFTPERYLLRPSRKPKQAH